MHNNEDNAKRIAKNTLMLYCQMLFSMVVTLYTSRVVLRTLGVEDYGIYNVVGGFVAMFSLVSSSLSSSVSRFLIFELGRGDMKCLRRAFSTSLLIQTSLAVIVFVLMETIGIWFLNNKMTIPVERMYAANWVFQSSILSFVLGLISVPYNASIIAHERMGTFAYIGILNVILRLIIVIFIAYSSWHFDKLIMYALLIVLVGILMQAIYWQYCREHFEECRFEFTFDKQYWKDMSSFAGWNFIGCTAGLLKDHGVNVLLNVFVGPAINAARGIAGTVIGAVSGFANNFMTALTPQITKSYAAGNHKYCHSLVERGARFSFFILFFIILPAFLEIDFVLSLWLGQYPAHTVNFIRLVFILTMIDVLSNTLITLANATGRIRNYQLFVGGTLLLNFPLSYVSLYLGRSPESTYVIAIIISVACLLLRLSFLRSMAHLSMIVFLKNVVSKVLIVAVVASFVPMIIHLSLPYGWGRFFLVGCSCVVCSAFVIYYLGCNREEQYIIVSKLVSIKHKFIKWWKS